MILGYSGPWVVLRKDRNKCLSTEPTKLKSGEPIKLKKMCALKASWGGGWWNGMNFGNIGGRK